LLIVEAEPVAATACSRTSRPGEEPFIMDERSARLAENEAIFRAGNESIDKAAGGRVEKVPYLCECGETSCLARVELTPAGYRTRIQASFVREHSCDGRGISAS
jgi:hypothetical protein